MLKRFLAAIAGAGLVSGFLGQAIAEPPSPNASLKVSAPLVHEGLALYLLRGASVPGPVPLTLEEGLAKGAIEVRETGSVRELRIENKGNDPVFVQLGDIVKGGRQDRVLTVSLLLQPRSGEVPIGAYCVERGRWSARGAEDVRRFAKSEALLPSREAKVAIAMPQAPVDGGLRTGLMRAPRSPIEAELEQRRLAQTAEGDRLRREAEALRATEGRLTRDSQTEVWRKVDELQRDLSARLAAPVASDRSRTSLQLSLENDRLKEAVEAYAKALEAKGLADDDVVGVAVAIGGRIVSADRYPSNGLFRKMWPKLVRAAATEALAEATAPAAAKAAAPTVATVEAFLADGSAGKASERFLGAVARIETRDAAKALRVRAVSGAASGSHLVHESYLAK
jgi:hypothetical protein